MPTLCDGSQNYSHRLREGGRGREGEGGREREGGRGRGREREGEKDSFLDSFEVVDARAL